MKPGSKFLTVITRCWRMLFCCWRLGSRLGAALSVVVVLANSLLGSHSMPAVLHVQIVLVACYSGSLAAFYPRSGLGLLILCKMLEIGRQAKLPSAILRSATKQPLSMCRRSTNPATAGSRCSAIPTAAKW